jgi:CubicO group peptidase (beta-lactamase class C family)
MAKSHLAVLFAACHAQGLVDLKDPAPVPEWSSPGDPRGAITFEHLIEMRDGLDFVEEYTDEDRSDVLEMLYGAGQADCARYAALRPARHEPGTRFNYSSGTSNILSRALGEVLEGPEAMRVALASCLFEPVSMRSAQPGFDEAGTWVASTNLHAVAYDYARFGLMLCRGGVAGGRRVVPQAWVDRWRTPRSQDDQGRWYSAHFWVMGDRFGTFYASGYEGQSITVCPPLDLVIVRLGSTPQSRKGALVDWRCRLIDQVATELGHAPSS